MTSLGRSFKVWQRQGASRSMAKLDARTSMVAALAGAMGPVVFTAGVLVGQSLWHGYNPMHDYISLLARGPFGWLQNTTFLVTGGLVAAFGLGLRGHLSSGPHGLHGSHAIVIGGVALGLLGLFETTVPGSHDTLTSSIHAHLFQLCQAASFTSVVLLYLHFRNDPLWQGLAPYSLATVILLIMVLVPDWVHATAGWQGIQQRLLAVVIACWVELLALKLWRVSRLPAIGT